MITLKNLKYHFTSMQSKQVMATWKREDSGLWIWENEMVNDYVIVGVLLESDYHAGLSLKPPLEYVLGSGMNVCGIMGHCTLWELSDLDIERMAIMEYHGNMDRVDAEVEFLIDHLKGVK